jgi:hypothetical protein
MYPIPESPQVVKELSFYMKMSNYQASLMSLSCLTFWSMDKQNTSLRTEVVCGEGESQFVPL